MLVVADIAFFEGFAVVFVVASPDTERTAQERDEGAFVVLY